MNYLLAFLLVALPASPGERYAAAVALFLAWVFQ